VNALEPIGGVFVRWMLFLPTAAVIAIVGATPLAAEALR